MSESFHLGHFPPVLPVPALSHLQPRIFPIPIISGTIIIITSCTTIILTSGITNGCPTFHRMKFVRAYLQKVLIHEESSSPSSLTAVPSSPHQHVNAIITSSRGRTVAPQALSSWPIHVIASRGCSLGSGVLWRWKRADHQGAGVGGGSDGGDLCPEPSPGKKRLSCPRAFTHRLKTSRSPHVERLAFHGTQGGSEDEDSA